MWVSFKQYDRPVLAEIRKVGLIPMDGSGADGIIHGFAVVDLDAVNLVGFVEGILEELIFEKGSEDPHLNNIYNTGVLGWYNSYERALEVFKDLQAALTRGERLFLMPES